MSVLQLKADWMPVTVLRISESSYQQIEAQLDASINKAPDYFKHAPLVIDLADMPRPTTGLDMQALCDLLRAKQIIPIGVRGLQEVEYNLAYQQGIAVFKASKTTKAASIATDKPISSTTPTKIITQPVRAGTQVYAQGGDLVVLSSVNAGAECLADGNIHIYGPLRGRALAGVQGNTAARIFCRVLEAELVAIAGYYWVSDEIPSVTQSPPGSLWQVFLQTDQLQLVEIQWK